MPLQPSHRDIHPVVVIVSRVPQRPLQLIDRHRHRLHAPLAAQASLLLTIGAALILVGLGFKIAAVPFHMWTPDVYDGAPTPVTAFMAAGVKAAGFAALVRVLLHALSGAADAWQDVVWWLAALTMIVGNLVALSQRSLKRMLAYSSIAHAGYILVAFAAQTGLGIAAVLFYLAAYALMKIGAFTIVSHLGESGERRLDIRDYAGLGVRQPFTAAALSLFLLSLLGLPVTQETMAQLGWPPGYVLMIGLIELTCLVLYLIPRTSLLGAVLMMGLLGGAMATQIRAGNPCFENYRERVDKVTEKGFARFPD